MSNSRQILARVNGKSVTYDEVAQECMDRYGREVLENVINRKLIQHACADKGVKVSEQEVGQEIVRISKRFGLDQDTWYNVQQIPEFEMDWTVELKSREAFGPFNIASVDQLLLKEMIDGSVETVNQRTGETRPIQVKVSEVIGKSG